MNTQELENESGPLIFGASVDGPLHIKENLPCQDACEFLSLASGLGFIAVSDGLGSAAQSDVGARLSVHTAINVARQLFLEQRADFQLETTVEIAVHSARKTLEEKAEAEQWNLRDLACTMITVAIQGNKAAVAHLGDGAVVGQVAGELRVISAPGESEYTNEVVPLTSSHWTRFLRLVPTINGVQFLAVFTDGCQRAALRKLPDSIEPFIGFFHPVFSYAAELPDPQEAKEEIRSLLSSKKLSGNSEDDKTLVIAVLKSL